MGTLLENLLSIGGVCLGVWVGCFSGVSLDEVAVVEECLVVCGVSFISVLVDAVCEILQLASRRGVDLMVEICTVEPFSSSL